MIFSFGAISTSVRPSLTALTSSMPPERIIGDRPGAPMAFSMSATDTPLLARLMTRPGGRACRAPRRRPRSLTAARIAGRSGVTGTRIRSASSKTARLSGL